MNESNEKYKETLFKLLKFFKDIRCSLPCDVPYELEHEPVIKNISVIEDVLQIPQSALQIKSATYGFGSIVQDVSEVLKRNVFANKISMRIDNYSMKCDPKPGVEKELRVLYVLDGDCKEKVIKEGELLEISEKNRDAIEKLKKRFRESYTENVRKAVAFRIVDDPMSRCFRLFADSEEFFVLSVPEIKLLPDRIRDLQNDIRELQNDCLNFAEDIVTELVNWSNS